MKMKKLHVKEKEVTIEVSDSGFGGSKPHTITLSVAWEGKRENAKELRVDKLSVKTWTEADRETHKQWKKSLAAQARGDKSKPLFKEGKSHSKAAASSSGEMRKVGTKPLNC